MSDLTLPDDFLLVPTAVFDEAKLIKLAREIAMDMREIPELLVKHGVSEPQWEGLLLHKRFMEIMSAERAAWEGAVNTHERVRLKAGAIMEEWLPEAYSRMVDPQEKLLDKVKAAELVARLAEMGVRGATMGAGEVDRVSITINLGADTHRYDKDVTPKVIENVVFTSGPTTENDDASAD